MSLISQACMQEVAHQMADRFSRIVQETGTLDEQQMRDAITQARREGEKVAFIRSGRTLQIINEIYCAF